MFTQMSEAVAACHDTFVFHRDIKSENFIVTDGWAFNQDGLRKRKVVIKLSDLVSPRAKPSHGLRKRWRSVHALQYDPYSSLSLPLSLISLHRAHKQRGPAYNPRAADVWSLGIVLINTYVFLFGFS